jgi:hypothetical protein
LFLAEPLADLFLAEPLENLVAHLDNLVAHLDNLVAHLDNLVAHLDNLVDLFPLQEYQGNQLEYLNTNLHQEVLVMYHQLLDLVMFRQREEFQITNLRLEALEYYLVVRLIRFNQIRLQDLHQIRWQHSSQIK